MENDIIEKYKKAGKIAREVREWSKNLVKEGVKTLYIAEEIEKKIKELGGEFAFPTNISINSIAAHSTPSINDETILKNGDVVKVDIGVQIEGFIADTAYTVEIGTKRWDNLIKASEEALKAAIEIVKPGRKVSEIGAVINDTMNKYGVIPIANLSGHEIKKYDLHAGITIPNFDNGSTQKIEESMVIAIEPFATNGIGKVSESKESEIFRLIGESAVRLPIARKIFDHVSGKYQMLPFCKRWISKEVGGFGIEAGIKELVRNGVLHHYPVLKEEKNGIVSQAEHTVIVLDKPIITTM